MLGFSFNLTVVFTVTISVFLNHGESAFGCLQFLGLHEADVYNEMIAMQSEGHPSVYVLTGQGTGDTQCEIPNGEVPKVMQFRDGMYVRVKCHDNENKEGWANAADFVPLEDDYNNGTLMIARNARQDGFWNGAILKRVKGSKEPGFKTIPNYELVSVLYREGEFALVKWREDSIHRTEAEQHIGWARKRDFLNPSYKTMVACQSEGGHPSVFVNELRGAGKTRCKIMNNTKVQVLDLDDPAMRGYVRVQCSNEHLEGWANVADFIPHGQVCTIPVKQPEEVKHYSTSREGWVKPNAPSRGGGHDIYDPKECVKNYDGNPFPFPQRGEWLLMIGRDRTFYYNSCATKRTDKLFDFQRLSPCADQTVFVDLARNRKQVLEPDVATSLIGEPYNSVESAWKEAAQKSKGILPVKVHTKIDEVVKAPDQGHFDIVILEGVGITQHKWDERNFEGLRNISAYLNDNGRMVIRGDYEDMLRNYYGVIDGVTFYDFSGELVEIEDGTDFKVSKKESHMKYANIWYKYTNIWYAMMGKKQIECTVKPPPAGCPGIIPEV